MTALRQEKSTQQGRRSAFGTTCPSCGSGVAADAKWCPSCRFTGGDTMTLFPDAPPPLMPLFDVADLWNGEDVKKIEAAREKLRRRFPQFHFHVCTVMLPPETKLPVFGFWLLNACPFYVNETAEDRSWTILLLINAKTGQAAVVPGYSAEHWLSDDDWRKVVSHMVPAWRSGKTVAAVTRYFETCASFLEHAWKARGSRRSGKSRS